MVFSSVHVSSPLICIKLCRDLQTCTPTERNSQNHKRHGGPSSLEKESKKLKEGHQNILQSEKIGAVVCTDGRDSQPAVRVTVADIKRHGSSSSSREVRIADTDT